MEKSVKQVNQKNQKNKTDVNALQGALEVRCRTGLPELNLSCAQSSIFFHLFFFICTMDFAAKEGLLVDQLHGDFAKS